jgi:hypothetical protein
MVSFLLIEVGFYIGAGILFAVGLVTLICEWRNRKC